MQTWKHDFIKNNREDWEAALDVEPRLADWLNLFRGADFSDTLQKFEWQCEPSNWGHMVSEMKAIFERSKFKWPTELRQNFCKKRKLVLEKQIMIKSFGRYFWILQKTGHNVLKRTIAY